MRLHGFMAVVLLQYSLAMLLYNHSYDVKPKRDVYALLLSMLLMQAMMIHTAGVYIEC